MTEAAVRSRRGAHRERRSALAVAGPVLGALVAVAVLAGGAVALIGQDDDPVVAERSVEPVELAPGSPSDAQDQPAPDEPVQDAPAAQGVTEGTSAPEAPVTGAPAPQESDAAADAAPTERLPVAVLNQTGRSGLAAAVAELVEGEGWTVSGTGNFTGTVSATTVYYPPGGEAAAQALAEDLPVPGRTRPTFGNLQPDTLTVVVTAEYP